MTTGRINQVSIIRPRPEIATQMRFEIRDGGAKNAQVRIWRKAEPNPRASMTHVSSELLRRLTSHHAKPQKSGCMAYHHPAHLCFLSAGRETRARHVASRGYEQAYTYKLSKNQCCESAFRRTASPFFGKCHALFRNRLWDGGRKTQPQPKPITELENQ